MLEGLSVVLLLVLWSTITFSKPNFLQPIHKNYLWIVIHFASRTLRVNNCWTEQPDLFPAHWHWTNCLCDWLATR